MICLRQLRILRQIPILQPCRFLVRQRRDIHLVHTAYTKATQTNHKVKAYTQLPDNVFENPIHLTIYKDGRKLESITSPKVSRLLEFVKPGQLLLRAEDSSTPHEFKIIEFDTQEPIKNFKADTKGRTSKQVHFTDPTKSSHIRTVLAKAYKMIVLGYPIECHFHICKPGTKDREKVKQTIHENPHLWPEVILKGMPEGTELIIPAYSNQNEVIWVMANTQQWQAFKPTHSFQDAHARLKKAQRAALDRDKTLGMPSEKHLSISTRQQKLDGIRRLENTLAQKGVYVKFKTSKLERKQRLAMGESREEINASMDANPVTKTLTQWRGKERMQYKAIKAYMEILKDMEPGEERDARIQKLWESKVVGVRKVNKPALESGPSEIRLTDLAPREEGGEEEGKTEGETRQESLLGGYVKKYSGQWRQGHIRVALDKTLQASPQPASEFMAAAELPQSHPEPRQNVPVAPMNSQSDLDIGFKRLPLGASKASSQPQNTPPTAEPTQSRIFKQRRPEVLIAEAYNKPLETPQPPPAEFPHNTRVRRIYMDGGSLEAAWNEELRLQFNQKNDQAVEKPLVRRSWGNLLSGEERKARGAMPVFRRVAMPILNGATTEMGGSSSADTPISSSSEEPVSNAASFPVQAISTSLTNPSTISSQSPFPFSPSPSHAAYRPIPPTNQFTKELRSSKSPNESRTKIEPLTGMRKPEESRLGKRNLARAARSAKYLQFLKDKARGGTPKWQMKVEWKNYQGRMREGVFL